MQIIGAGFGRTGTMSLCAALEKLGYAPCYHFLELFKHPGHIKIWQAASDGQEVDWQDFLGRYPSGLDYPIVGFYEELMAAFPDAKVILTVRDPQKWYDSTMQTIYRGTIVPKWFLALLPPFRHMNKMIDATAWNRIFDGRFEDRDYAVNIYETHIENVKCVVPAERLLIFEVKEGWEPLCQFLDKPIPDDPFPYINDRRTTKLGYLFARIVTAVLVLGLFVLVLWLFSRML